jgi:AcrR family transcriptional regulator
MTASPPRRRNRNYDETHRALLEKAIELISQAGTEALSVAALARAAGMNRATVYYHFDGREAMLAAVRAWSSEQLARGFNPAVDRQERIAHIARFVLANPEIIKLWIDEFIAPGDMRSRYPDWDALVAGIARLFRAGEPGEDIDAEVYCTLLLTGAFIGPRVFHQAVRPDLGIEDVVERFTREQERILRREGLLNAWGGAA